MFNTRKKSGISKTHVFFCLLYKQNSVKNNKTSVAMRFTTIDIFTRKNIVFLRVFKYDFSQWPKTIYNTYVYIININVCQKNLTLRFYIINLISQSRSTSSKLIGRANRNHQISSQTKSSYIQSCNWPS
jgi:hypothetical protein